MVAHSNHMNERNTMETSYESILTRELYSYFGADCLSKPTLTEAVTPTQSPLYCTLAWTHKKGKAKKQQFWVYCEDNQYNYCQVTVNAPNLSLGSLSALARLSADTTSLLVVENRNETQCKCLCVNTGRNMTLPKSDLTFLVAEDFTVETSLQADASLPDFPGQGDAAAVNIIEHNVVECRGLSMPLGSQAQYIFKNRTEGWFRIHAKVAIGDRVIAEGASDVFMFNNPRMTGKRQLNGFSCQEIKLMQRYAQNVSDHSACLASGLELGLSADRMGVMFEKATDVFKPAAQKTASKKLTGTKRPHPDSPSPLPATKKVCREEKPSKLMAEFDDMVVPTDTFLTEISHNWPVVDPWQCPLKESRTKKEDDVPANPLASLFASSCNPLPSYCTFSGLDDLVDQPTDALVPENGEDFLQWVLNDISTMPCP